MANVKIIKKEQKPSFKVSDFVKDVDDTIYQIVKFERQDEIGCECDYDEYYFSNIATGKLKKQSYTLIELITDATITKLSKNEILEINNTD